MVRLDGRSSGYVYAAYLAALRALAECRRGGVVGEAVEKELLEYLGMVLRGPGLGDALEAVRSVLAEASAPGDCVKRLTGLEEENYPVIRSVLHSLASMEVLSQSWRARQAALVLEAIKHSRSEQLTPRGSLLVTRSSLIEAAQRSAAPSQMRTRYYSMDPWRRLEIEQGIDAAISALSTSGVIMESTSLGAYIVPAPFLEEEFLAKLREPL